MFKIENKNIIIKITLIILILSVSLFIIESYWPQYENRFFEIGLLGPEGYATDYFPNEDAIINIGTPLNWKIYVNNHMGEAQKIKIKVKFLNSSFDDPYEYTTFLDESIIEYDLDLEKDEYLVIPFELSILNARFEENYYTITRTVNQTDGEGQYEIEEQLDAVVVKDILINNQLTEINKISTTGGDYRIVFELWVYDENLGNYGYGWVHEGKYHSAIVYLWFNVEV